VTLEERVAFLEGRVEEQTRQTDGIREAMVHMEERMDRRFEAVDLRLQTFEDRLDRRLDGVDRRFEALERRFDTTDEKYSRYFTWILAAQVTTLAALVTAFVAR
jgi:chaperonin cofactor prefoldin